MSPARSATPPAVVRTALALAGCLMFVVAGCASGQAPHRPARDAKALARAYLAIAEPANHRLDVEVDAYDDAAHHDLAAAASALRAQAATERQFDRELARIGFPPRIAATARALIGVNEIRARLVEREAKAASISELRTFTSAHEMADAQVEARVRMIRSQLGLPPPETS
jgi:hypothetical protein